MEYGKITEEVGSSGVTYHVVPTVKPMTLRAGSHSTGAWISYLFPDLLPTDWYVEGQPNVDERACFKSREVAEKFQRILDDESTPP